MGIVLSMCIGPRLDLFIYQVKQSLVPMLPWCDEVITDSLT